MTTSQTNIVVQLTGPYRLWHPTSDTIKSIAFWCTCQTNIVVQLTGPYRFWHPTSDTIKSIAFCCTLYLSDKNDCTAYRALSFVTSHVWHHEKHCLCCTCQRNIVVQLTGPYRLWHPTSDTIKCTAFCCTCHTNISCTAYRALLCVTSHVWHHKNHWLLLYIVPVRQKWLYSLQGPIVSDIPRLTP